MPLFASRTRLVAFDPQVAFLPGVDPSNPGISIDWATAEGAAAVRAHADFFAPFRGAFGCDLMLTGASLPGLAWTTS